MVRLEAAAIYAGINILLLLLLAYLVVRARQTHKVALGDGGNKAVLHAVRAHANAAEYIPAGLVGLLILALLDPAAPVWLLHAAGISLTAGRISHAIGLHTGTLNIGRTGGIALTWIAYLLIGGGLIYAGLAQRL
ncbi:MAG: MAPEG family protein [Pseudomonadota bacterium]